MTNPNRKRQVIIGSIVGVVVLGVIAWFAVPQIYAAAQPEADAVPTIDATAGTTDNQTGDSNASFAGEWQVGAGSFAGYRVDEVLNGADVTVTGRTETVSGSLTTTEDSVTAATIEVDIASIATDNPNRDDYFANDAMQADQFPTATFTLTEPVVTDGAVAVGETLTTQLTGDLTMHGVTQQVTFEAQVAVNADSAQVVGSIPVTFEDFGVTAPSLGFVSVQPTGFVEFSLELTR